MSQGLEINVVFWMLFFSVLLVIILLERWKIPKISLLCKLDRNYFCDVRAGFVRHTMIHNRLLGLAIIIHLILTEVPEDISVWFVKYFDVFLLLGIQIYTALYWRGWGVKNDSATK